MQQNKMRDRKKGKKKTKTQSNSSKSPCLATESQIVGSWLRRSGGVRCRSSLPRRIIVLSHLSLPSLPLSFSPAALILPRTPASSLTASWAASSCLLSPGLALNSLLRSWRGTETDGHRATVVSSLPRDPAAACAARTKFQWAGRAALSVCCCCRRSAARLARACSGFPHCMVAPRECAACAGINILFPV